MRNLRNPSYQNRNQSGKIDNYFTAMDEKKISIFGGYA